MTCITLLKNGKTLTVRSRSIVLFSVKNLSVQIQKVSLEVEGGLSRIIYSIFKVKSRAHAKQPSRNAIERQKP